MVDTLQIIIYHNKYRVQFIPLHIWRPNIKKAQKTAQNILSSEKG